MELFTNLKREDLKKLFDNFYQYKDKVLQFRDYTKQIIEVPEADPETFRKVSGFYADKNHVFYQCLQDNSPEETITNAYGHNMNNPDAKWQISIVQGLDGKSFNYIQDKYDTVYWKDKNGIYIKRNGSLKALENVDKQSFTYLNFLYGKDNKHIYYEDQILPIDVNEYSLDQWGFIKDQFRIFHYDFEIGLDPKSFEVVYYNLIKQPIILEDKNGKYEYTRSIREDSKIIKQEG